MHLTQKCLCFSVLILLSCCHDCQTLGAAQAIGDDGSCEITEYLVLPAVGQYGRTMLHRDPLQAEIAEGAWRAPSLNDPVISVQGTTCIWQAGKVSDKGLLDCSQLRGGYALATVESPESQVLLLEASGHACIIFNGVPHAGDPYGTGQSIIPLELKKGTNELLFHIASSALEAQLRRPESEVFFDLRDLTIPSLIREASEKSDSRQTSWMGVLLVNCRKSPLDSCVLKSTTDSAFERQISTTLIPPLSVRKIRVAFNIPARIPASEEIVSCQLELLDKESKYDLAACTIELPVVETDQPRQITYPSELDDSVQSYWFQSSANAEGNSGLLVALHELGEHPHSLLANLPRSASLNYLVPYGRRIESCDWEGWALNDGIEAIEDCQKRFAFPAERQILLGRESGAHGALRISTAAPDRWSAIALLDPWLDYNPIVLKLHEKWPTLNMIARVETSNRLSSLLPNLGNSRIYLLWSNSLGQRLRSPESRSWADLESIHPDFRQESIGDRSEESVMKSALEFCTELRREDPGKPAQVDTTCYEPGSASRNAWLSIEQQFEQGFLSRAFLRYDDEEREFRGLTVNVAALSLSTSHLSPNSVVRVVLDGQLVGEFERRERPLVFENEGHFWHHSPLLPRTHKQARRSGGFLNAWRNNCLLVYATQGTPEENAWALAKARFDAETLLARANGSVDVISDQEFLSSSPDRERNAILYGHADSNAAWPRLLSSSPIQVRRGVVSVGTRPEKGDDLACMFVRPRPRSTGALVGVVAGTGLQGMRATDRLPYFVHGISYPDFLLFSSKALATGYEEVRALGYFGQDWNLTSEIVWRDAAL